MPSKSKVQIIAIVGAIILFVLIYNAPKQSAESKTLVSEVDAKINLAISLVEEGREPMKGIMMLKEVVEQNPDNLEAHLKLGLFSLKSEQYEKAIDRFKKVLEIDPNYVDAYLYLADAYVITRQKDLAIESLKKCKSIIGDSSLIIGIENYIKEIKNS